MKCIVYATDFSESAARAEREAVRLAKALAAPLILAHFGTDATLWREAVYTPEMRTLVEGQRGRPTSSRHVPRRWLRKA